MTTDDQATRKTITMYPAHWAIVEQFAQAQYYGNISGAMRRIVDEWMALTGRDEPTLLVDTKAEYVTE